MKETAEASSVGEAKTRPGGKPYHRPELRNLGKLHLLTQGTGGMRADAGGVMDRAMVSDRRCKHRVVRAGTHPLGIGLYLFDYKPQFHAAWGSGRRFGLMADEVEAVLPQAVSVHPDGYKRVNYAMLGLDLGRSAPETCC